MALTTKTIRRLLQLTNVLLGIAVALVVVLAAMPLDSADVSSAALGPKQASTQPAGAPKSTLERYAVLWQRDLLQPLFDPPPAVVVKAEPAKPKLDIRLVCTAIEPGNNRGFFSVPGKGTILAGVGETVSEAVIKTIDDGAAVVTFNGEEITLKVQKDK